MVTVSVFPFNTGSFATIVWVSVKLILTAVRHVYTACTDGTVKHFHQSLLGTARLSQSRMESHASFTSATLFLIEIIILFDRHLNFHIGLLMCSVGIKERTLDI